MYKFGEFEKFGEKVERYDGIEQILFRFQNGYGASIIKGGCAFGNSTHPYELAVIKQDGDNWELCYSTEITDDVIGYLDERGVIELLRKIQELEGIENGNIQYQ